MTEKTEVTLVRKPFSVTQKMTENVQVILEKWFQLTASLIENLWLEVTLRV